MKTYLLLCAVFVLINKIWAVNNNFSFTYAMALRCKEHICRHGYNYDTFYRIDEKTLQHATVKRDNTDVSYFEMHIAIQAASNGHILLSPVAHPGPTDPVYEIVVGGGGNRFTELRLNLKRNARSSVKTPNILSTIEFTAFFIKITDDGLVEFGKEGDSLPIINYYDAHTLPIKYFSFASWAGVEAKFLYDCPSNADDATTPDSQAVEPKLSNSDELKRTLLMSKLPSIPPSPTVQVQLGIKLTHVKCDALESKLKTRMAVVMSWTDDSMAWSPTKFNGTTNLRFRQGQIWRPMFFVYNSDNTDPLDTTNPDLISMVYSGEATFHFQTEVTTWCFDSNSEPNKWPHDDYHCSIVIEPWEIHEKIVIDNMDEGDRKMSVYTDVDELIQSDWEVSYEKMVVKPSVWDKVYHSDDNITRQSDRYIITMHLKRQATTCNIVIYTPLLVLLTFVLMSFWGDPLEMSRVWFYAGCALVICLGLSNINFLVPTHTMPSILILYITVLDGVVLALVIHVLLMTSLAETLCKTTLMQSCLTFSLLRSIFCLPPIKISLDGGYSRQEDSDDTSLHAGSVEESENEDKTYGNKKELAVVLDKLMFAVYSITIAVMLAAHY